MRPLHGGKLVNKMILLVLLSMTVAGSAQAQATFVLGALFGAALGSEETTNGTPNGMMIYTAPVETLKSVNPFDVRQIAVDKCFTPDHTSDARNQTLRELFATAIKAYGEKPRILLQIVRVLDLDTSRVDADGCATIWFSYVEK
jgi:hypothetical protein